MSRPIPSHVIEIIHSGMVRNIWKRVAKDGAPFTYTQLIPATDTEPMRVKVGFLRSEQRLTVDGLGDKTAAQNHKSALGFAFAINWLRVVPGGHTLRGYVVEGKQDVVAWFAEVSS